MSKRKKNKNTYKQKSHNYYTHQTKSPKQVKEIALKVFGSLYYSPKQDSI